MERFVDFMLNLSQKKGYKLYNICFNMKNYVPYARKGDSPEKLMEKIMRYQKKLLPMIAKRDGLANRILHVILQNPGSSNYKIAQKMNMSERSNTNTYLRRLRRASIIKSEKSSKYENYINWSYFITLLENNDKIKLFGFYDTEQLEIIFNDVRFKSLFNKIFEWMPIKYSELSFYDSLSIVLMSFLLIVRKIREKYYVTTDTFDDARIMDLYRQAFGMKHFDVARIRGKLLQLQFGHMSDWKDHIIEKDRDPLKNVIIDDNDTHFTIKKNIAVFFEDFVSKNSNYGSLELLTLYFLLMDAHGNIEPSEKEDVYLDKLPWGKIYSEFASFLDNFNNREIEDNYNRDLINDQLKELKKGYSRAKKELENEQKQFDQVKSILKMTEEATKRGDYNKAKKLLDEFRNMDPVRSANILA